GGVGVPPPSFWRIAGAAKTARRRPAGPARRLQGSLSQKLVRVAAWGSGWQSARPLGGARPFRLRVAGAGARRRGPHRGPPGGEAVQEGVVRARLGVPEPGNPPQLL